MSRYGQFCGVARALDVVGDRWALLVVRELLIGPRRFTQLRAGLPGIASNLLVRRLDGLQEAGVVERRLADRGHVYALTTWGEDLRGVIYELVRWSARTMASGPAPDDTFHPRWMLLALEALLDGARPGRRVRVLLEVGGWRALLDADDDGGVRVTQVGAGDASGGAEPDGARAEPDGAGVESGVAEPDAVLSGPGPMILGVAAGFVPLERLLAAGRLTGDRAAVEALLASRAPAGRPVEGVHR